MRRRRFAFFLSLLGKVPRPIRILDVGGTHEFWSLMGLEQSDSVKVVLLNVGPQVVPSPQFESVIGDARNLTQYADGAFDVVFSNSVIEHLGPSKADLAKMAGEVMRVGKRYFVQTPNKYFPLEPHFLFPAFQFLPLAVRTWLVSHYDIGWYKRIPDPALARKEVESILLLSERELRNLFPGCSIYKERFFGLPKSFVAHGGWPDLPRFNSSQSPKVAASTAESLS